MKRYCGFLLYPVLAVLLLAWFPISGLPTWETWFDSLGEYWGMAMVVALTFFILLFLPCFVAGALNRLPPLTGGLVMFGLSFSTIVLFYAFGPSTPYQLKFRIKAG